MGEAIVYTRRWSRVEYEQMIETGLFRPDERLELLDREVLSRGLDETVAPVGAPAARIPVADLLP
jgi:hypothetical protein